MQALLSFEQAPPFSAPLRFFLTAPILGMLAGGLLLLEGPDILSSRWSPAVLALTHLLVIGFMLQVMLGALIQILPVVAGANIRRPQVVAVVTHLLLLGGALALPAGFVFAWPLLLHLGASLLALAIGLFLLAGGWALFRVPSTSPTIRGLKLALSGLFAVAVLGLFLVLALRQGTQFSLLELTDLHAAWGLAGWSGILLLSVAYVVVPMFQLTPGYPARAGWCYPRLIFAFLLLWTVALPLESVLLIRLAKAGLALAGIAFCGLTLRLQSQRRRAKIDATARYWQLGLLASIIALFMMLTASIWPVWAEADSRLFFFAILLLIGGFVSFIVGMLYKIIPFLAWLHLQNRGRGLVLAPTMNKLLADKAMLRQFYAHLACLLLLLLAVFFPAQLMRVAGFSLLLSMGWLAMNLMAVVRNYQMHAREIDLKLPSP